MNETIELQEKVIQDLLDVLKGSNDSSFNNNNLDTMGNSSTKEITEASHVKDIAALQIQLYSRPKDTSLPIKDANKPHAAYAKNRHAAYDRAMSVSGVTPPPHTLAIIEEQGGRIHMSRHNFNDASKSFSQAFKSYDEAGDRRWLRCLKYSAMVDMFHVRTDANPFDSHEARAHRDHPEIVATRTLVQAFHNNEYQNYERILEENEGGFMNDEYVRELVRDNNFGKISLGMLHKGKGHEIHVITEISKRKIKHPESIENIGWLDVKNLLRMNEYQTLNNLELAPDMKDWSDNHKKLCSKIVNIKPQSEMMMALLSK